MQDIISVCRVAKQSTHHPLILKVSYLHSLQIIREASKYVEAVHAINSVPWRLVFPNKKSPLAKHGGGGFSGPIIAPFARKKVGEIVEAIFLPVIAGGGISCLEDVLVFRELGAQGFSIGSLFFRPWEPNRLVRQYKLKLANVGR